MFTISLTGFREKPSTQQIKLIKLQSKDLSLDELEGHIREGYALSAFYSSSYPMTLKQKTYENFSFSSFIMFDLDNDIPFDLTTLVDSLAIQPTLAYTTFSHQMEGKGNRYRLLYIFDKPIDSIHEFKALYSYICNECKLSINDNCGNRAVQLCFGSKYGCELIRTDNILSLNDIKGNEEYNKILKRITGHYDINKKRTNTFISNCPPDVVINNKDYIEDYYKLSDIELFEKYDGLYPFFDDNNLLPTVSEDEPIIEVPEDFIGIKRRIRRIRHEPVLHDDSSHGNKIVVLKWKDGENRRKKLYLNGILRRFMKEDLTFEHLLHCISKEVFYYYDNSDGTLNKPILYEIALNVMKTNLDNYTQYRDDYKRCNPKFKVNKSYCRKYGIDPRSVAGKYRIISKDEERKKVFDPALTDRENCEIFKEFGLGTNERTVRRFRERYGIGNFRERNNKVQV